jgi:ubiquinone/menaquinone biosynthesis C-methylase UbiE
MTEFTGIKKDLLNYWNTQGSIYDFGYESDEECTFWRKTLYELIKEPPVKILDVGTGTGFLAMNLVSLGYDVTGIDFSEGMMEQAREKMKKKNLSWNLVKGDAENPDFSSDTFDCIICRYLLWTLPNPEVALRNWYKILKPGGKMIIIDGKRKRTSDSVSSRFNKSLWAISRRICRGYIGIQGHNQDIEKNLPFFEGIGDQEILKYYTDLNLKNCKVRNLDELNKIIKRNLPWFVRFGYKSSGVIQVVYGEKF